jgi:parallel beta-helix repeat protein
MITISFLFTSSFLIVLNIIPTITSNPPVTITVDDDEPADYSTIQEGVDAASSGDIVFVRNGVYYEDVVIDKTINLTGEDRDNTIINCSSIGIRVENVDYVNVSGFTIENGSSAGIRLIPSNNSLIYGNRVENNRYGIQIIESDNTIIKNNIASNNSNYHGIYLDRSTNITVTNNICFRNQGTGIFIFQDSSNNIITGNNCSFNTNGIYITSGFNNHIYNNILFSNFNYGIGDSSDGGNIYINNSIKNSWTGILVGTFTQNVKIFNSTIENSSGYDISIAGSDTHFTIINTTFDRSKSVFGGLPTNLLIVKWYLHVNIIDYLGNSVPNAKVKIGDNVNGSYNETFGTDVNGYLRWLTFTEYIEQDTDGDTIGEKIHYTPHQIIATIILYNGTFLELDPGWNLVSLTRIQSDTKLQTVLQSIEGLYDTVQWYNVADSNDPWKHYHVSKPSSINDLKELNHTMGFWLDITDSQGAIVVVLGDELIANQSFVIYPGWNLIGYPSNSRKLRDNALNNLNFGSEVDRVEKYNATTKRIEEVASSDYFEMGQAYWIHSKVEKVWNVPL